MTDLEKFDRPLRLMVLLTQNRSLSVDNICTELKMSKRSVYRYLDAFRDMGFKLEKEGTRYRLDHSSPFFAEITHRTRLTDEEAATVFKMLSATPGATPEIRSLRAKMANLYNRKELTGCKVADAYVHGIAAIYDAMRLERRVILQRYVDPETGAVTDRIVEPYLLLPGDRELYAYDVTSEQNEVFRLSRARRIEMLDLVWTHTVRHLKIETDVFFAKGKAELPLQFSMTASAAIDLLRQYPGTEDYIRPEKNGGERIRTKVCDYEAPARFVLSHFDEVKLVAGSSFAKYVQEKALRFAERFSTTPNE